MTVFMNLHELPAGKAMYTIYVTEDEEGTPRDEVCTEEMDIVYDDRAPWGDIVSYGKDASGDRVVDLYGSDSRVVGVVNQSDGIVLFDEWRDAEDDNDEVF